MLSTGDRIVTEFRGFFGLIAALLALFAIASHHSDVVPAADNFAAAHQIITRRPADVLPADWQLDAISAAASPIRSSRDGQFLSEHGEVLAWQITRDSRLLTKEECLVWKEFQFAADDPYWALAIVYRHPPETGWHLSERRMLIARHGNVDRRCDQIRYFRKYEKRPSSADIETFKRVFAWSNRPNDGWDFIAAGICAQAWHRVIGEPLPDEASRSQEPLE
jgi:hypothetical protein